MHQSFLTYRSGLWFWVSLLFCALLIFGYAMQDLPQPPNGGTWYGYGVGTIGALLIVWLLYLGRRKRNYSSGSGTLQGWTSAHVYLGASLLVVATLHAGFQFGLNIHTLAYVLMCLVIFSGFFGVWAYLRYPALMSENAGGKTRAELYREVAEIDRQLQRQVKGLPGAIQRLIASTIERTHIGGSAWQQLSARDSSVVALEDEGLVANPDQQRTIDHVVDRLSQTSHAEQAGFLREVSSLLGARGRLLRRIRRDIQVHALLKIWLYFHVPLSFATLAALITHVFAVFVYW